MTGTSKEGALVEFSYVSRVGAFVSQRAILRLAQDAFRFNTRAGLSGRLSFDSGKFSQIIEGPSEVVLPLASRILTDTRHCDISILSFGPIAVRRYADWRFSGFGALETPRTPLAANIQNIAVLHSAAVIGNGAVRQIAERLLANT
jgi:Sensors of blue-light using FAD